MKSKLLSLVIFLCLAINLNGQIISDEMSLPLRSSDEKPSSIFAPGFISLEDRSEFGSIYNRDENEFYFAVDKDGKAEILYTYLDENQKWVEPVVILSHEKYSFNDPFLSPDESELYYISDMPRNDQDTISDYDIWYSVSRESGWSGPINAGPSINSNSNEYYISFTKEGKMYFSSNRAASADRQHNYDIYTSERKDGQYLESHSIGEPINTGRYEADVFIAPDESYIIYSSAKEEGFGRGDLYISFRNSKDRWEKPENMGKTINTENHELCPFVTQDGKYLLYTSNNDIYKINASIFRYLDKSQR